jgi:hypothetical protein
MKVVPVSPSDWSLEKNDERCSITGRIISESFTDTLAVATPAAVSSGITCTSEQTAMGK